MKIRVHGHKAIEQHEKTGEPLCHYTTPIEEHREGITVDRAEEIAREDAGLIYLDVETITLSEVVEAALGKLRKELEEGECHLCFVR